MPDVYRDWDATYTRGTTPWDMGLAEDALVKFVESGLIKPCRTLELGCGHGNDAIFLAQKGFDVTAVDISKNAIVQAKERASRAKVSCTFIAEDATDLKSIIGTFSFVYDRACFHFVHQERRDLYLKMLRTFLEPGGYFLLIVSSNKDAVQGPYQFSEKDIERLFEKDFNILRIELITLEQHKERPTPYLCVMKRKQL